MHHSILLPTQLRAQCANSFIPSFSLILAFRAFPFQYFALILSGSLSFISEKERGRASLDGHENSQGSLLSATFFPLVRIRIRKQRATEKKYARRRASGHVGAFEETKGRLAIGFKVSAHNGCLGCAIPSMLGGVKSRLGRRLNERNKNTIALSLSLSVPPCYERRERRRQQGGETKSCSITLTDRHAIVLHVRK